MKDVFGGMSEDELHLGLVDQDTFEANLATLKDRWNGIEVSNHYKEQSCSQNSTIGFVNTKLRIC